jgi:hypothetical protein
MFKVMTAVVVVFAVLAVLSVLGFLALGFGDVWDGEWDDDAGKGE